MEVDEIYYYFTSVTLLIYIYPGPGEEKTALGAKFQLGAHTNDFVL